MRRWPALLSVGLAFASPAATAASPPCAVAAVAGREQFVLRSAAGFTYRILVARPDGPVPKAGYPVVYLLDPETAFETLVEIVRTRALTVGPVVVVGIGQPDGAAARMRDFTPPTDQATLPADNMGRPWGEMGGADTFLTFIETVLKPDIEKRLPIDRAHQALFGHSMGGLFVLHALFEKPGTFQTYVASSPSIWWGGKAIMRDAAAFRRHPSTAAAGTRLLLTVGGLEATVQPADERWLALNTDPAEWTATRRRYRDYVRSIAQVANAAALYRLLTANGKSGPRVHYVRFDGEDHVSVIPSYLARGVSELDPPPEER